MRIAFSGAANVGKSTLIQKVKERWPMYASPKGSYRDILIEENLEHSSNTTEETQLKILDWMMKIQSSVGKDVDIFYDRCTLDNLVYTLQGNARGDISDEVTAATISFVRESMKDIDIIFWIPFNDQIPIVNDSLRDVDVDFIKETDEIFKQMYDHYSNNMEEDVFFPKDDCPAIIPMEMVGLDDRLWFVGEFINERGELIEPDESILTEENLKLMADMQADQETAQAADDEINKIMKDIDKK